jgi:hypothetical protein
MSTFFPDCYDEWSLERVTYDGDHPEYETLFEGTEGECRLFAHENYTEVEQTSMCLMDWEGREWDV